MQIHSIFAVWKAEMDANGIHLCKSASTVCCGTMSVCWADISPERFSLLEQFDVAHDELLPVDKDHGHFLLRQQLTLQQRFVEDLQNNTMENMMRIQLFVHLQIPK